MKFNGLLEVVITGERYLISMNGKKIEFQGL